MRKLALASLILLAATPAVEAAPAGLAAHRAVYDLSLKDANESSGIAGMVGRMVYEFNGSACEGYSVSFRFVTEIDNGENSRVTDQQTTTFEDIRRGTFNFVTRSFVNQDLDFEVRGSALADPERISVALELPKKQHLDFDRALFPTEHMIKVIEQAKSGKQFYEARIYDGSDNGDATMVTTTILGAQQTSDAGDPDAGAAGELADDVFWPATISYFNDNGNGDGLPVYTIAFKLYENGVTRDLTMDYGDFVLNGRLARLEFLEVPACGE